MTTKERLKNKDEARWVPVPRGGIFCSPACGFDCTRAEYIQAIKNGDRLAGACAKTGYGQFWQRRVWENMGWYYEAHTTPAGFPGGKITIDKRSKRYWADIHTKGGMQFEALGDTPKLAIEAALAKARRLKSDVDELLGGVSRPH